MVRRASLGLAVLLACGPKPADETTGTEAGSTSATEPAPTTSGGETGGGESGGAGGECRVDADCKLMSDCCECWAVPGQEEPGMCKLGCEQERCEQFRISGAACRLGRCVPRKAGCSGEVLCDEPPPECQELWLPGIADGCWTGACVPGWLCDQVPDCSYCGDWMCVVHQAWTETRTCEPIPVTCGEQPSCACAGACEEPFSACGDGANGEIVCACPSC